MTSEGDPNPLITLLRECVVRVDAAGGFLGTGFFVSPGRVATCAHVVRGAADLLVSWHDRESVSATVAGAIPPRESVADRAFYPLPDLAVVDLGADAAAWDHPCVHLATDPPVLDSPPSVLYLAGYTDEFKKGNPVLTGVGTEFEFEVSEEPCTIYKLKRGQVRPGYSGSPLLDRRAGAVAGIVDASRGVGTDLGGFAVPATELTNAFPDMAGANRKFHEEDPRWKTAVENERVRAAERAG